MPHPNSENIKRAIEDVQQAYDELNAQWLAKLKEADELKERLGKLEAGINPLKAILSMIEESQGEAVGALLQPIPLKPSASVPSASLIEKPHLQGGIEILREAGRPMHLPEIVAEFRKRRWKLSERNGRETLRVTFNKHIGTIFVKTKRGQYGLKEPLPAAFGPKPIRIMAPVLPKIIIERPNE
ncbi:MAG: HTH domain-containing protein [Desulfobaccales bacterium]